MPLVMIKSDPRARDKPCLRCGYSLRGSLDARFCPECGLSVWLSLNSNDTLDWSNPQWLRKLSSASYVLAVVQLASLVPYAAWGAAELFDERWAVLAALTGGMYLGAYAIGLIMLADYEGRHPDRWKAYRIGCRSTAGLAVVVALVLMGSIAHLHAILLPHLIKAAVTATSIATWAYYRKLAQRVPNSLLARVSGYLALLPIFPLLALLKFVPFFAIFAVFEIYNLLDFLPILYLPASVVLLVWFARIFTRASNHAKQGWATESAPTSV